MPTNTATVTVPEGTTTVVVQVEPAPPNEERMADLSALFALVIGACVVIWGAKQVLNLFSVNPED